MKGKNNISAMSSKKTAAMKNMILILPFMILLALFTYYPLYGWRYAFYDYRPPKALDDCEFVGMRWFLSLVENETKRQQLYQVLKNTFAMSLLSIATSWLPMLFAVFLQEVSNKKIRKTVQTVTTIPNFVSWILVYSLAYSIFSSDGMLNTLLINLGILDKPVLYLQSSEHTYLTMWLFLLWKTLGWNAIMYIAALTGVDSQLYEAAKVDGASRMQLIWHVTIPSLLPTYFVLLMLEISNFLNNGMEQYFVFQNAFNSETIQVLDLYVYNLGLKGGGYSLATAVSMLKSLVSITLLAVINKASKALRGESII